ncbi:peptidoglycan DD-metalloendopeptidase family protein [Parvularcula dongshanensis]|uniref:Murein DD-endopeptidase MepM/ murein hydrolase activator NlpD n=1 Tax=Parvularcula dongshanensis TaxID=1173995 RepID=A0A840I494_9PROT|nr:murein DD-endopeptidase MepM/ murein hydrolase activator NlpD [Parvularcula dongshanensis]
MSACASTPKTHLARPLSRYDVSAEFGERRGLGRKPHQGMDLRAPRGTPVAAAGGGRVIFRGEKRGYGNIVILDHGGDLLTYYAHLDGFAVGSGERVAPGQTLGFVGRTGNATGAHLHFETRRSGKPVDPRGYVRL